jgi:hypothetical protein
LFLSSSLFFTFTTELSITIVNYVHSDGELEEDLEDGEIADDDEVEEGAIRDEGGVTAKKREPSPPKPPDRQNVNI